MITNHEFVSYEELYEAYLDCRKRKRKTINALDFEINDNIKLYNLWKDLNSLKYKIGKSITFIVDKPIKREIFAADFRDRIVHHLVIKRLLWFFEKRFIDDSYSCRLGKGTLYGAKRLKNKIKDASNNYSKDCYILKCDLKSFFMTINKNILFDKIVFMLKNEVYNNDRLQLLFMKILIGQIIYNAQQYNCIRKQPLSKWNNLPKNKSLFHCKYNYGLPIGNLTSQIFANFYLCDFDDLMTKNFKYYGRYVDDFYIITNSKNDLPIMIKLIKNELKKIEVILHPKKMYFQHYSKGIKFIGSVVKINRFYINNRTKGNFYWKLKNMSIENNAHEKITSTINSYLGLMKHHMSYNIRKKLLKNFLHKYNYSTTLKYDRVRI